jgi:DNA mismatch repair protein MutS2
MTATTEAATAAPSTVAGAASSVSPEAVEAALTALEFPSVLALVAERTVGPLGAAALLARRPGGDREWIERELGTVGEVLALLRDGERLEVLPVPDIRLVLARLRVDGSVLDVSELELLLRTLRAGRELLVRLGPLEPSCPLLVAARVAPIDRDVERALERAIGPDGELLDGASPALAAARREVHQARDRVIDCLEGVRRQLEPSVSTGDASITMRNGRYVIPVRRDARRRPDGILHDESGSAGTLFIEPTVAIGPGNAFRSAIAAEEREALAVLRRLSALARPHADAIAALHAFAVDVDTVVARARWAMDCHADVPALLSAGGSLRLCQARHPLLLARGVDVVPFELELHDDERTLLITGPNAGGKTVLLKTVALMPALAQAGIVPPVGPGTRLPIVHRWFIDIGDHQSINADLSTFSAHVAVLRTVLSESDTTSMVVLDEIGSGTDPAEGGALAMAALGSLTRRGALTVATTHLGSLKTLATTVPGVVNGSLQFDGATLSPTYRFVKGVPGRSYGLAIARRFGVDAAVLAAAERLVPDAERELDRLLADVERRRNAIGDDEARLAALAAGLQRREAAVAATEAQQAAREAELRRQDKEAARERARQARAYLLEARKRVEQALAMARNASEQAAASEARRLVEEGIRAESRRADENPGEDRGGAEGLAVGDAVTLSTGAAGEVVEVRSDDRVVVQVGAMRLVVTHRSLTRVDQPQPKPPVASPSGDARLPEAPSEIDLRGLRVDEAETVLAAAIDGAVLTEQPQLAIIHGMGTGALREAVRRQLAADRRVAHYEFAPRQQGGTGVTIAVLR